MAYGLIDYNTLKDIGNALREKASTNVNYYPRDMARAITSIVTSNGIDEPCVFSMDQYYSNAYDNSIIHRDNAVGFEVCNNLQTLANSTNLKIIDAHAEWSSISPDNVVFYEREGTFNEQNGLIYGFYIDNKWANNKASAIDISNLFPYCYKITEPYCSKYTTKMVNSYYSCSNIRNAVCGDSVMDMTNAYMYCGNLVNAACGNNVKIMNGAYYYCGNVNNIVIGPNVKYADSAYYSCYNATGDVDLKNNLIKIDNAFYNCININKFSGDLNNVISANGAFNNCYKSTFDKFELSKLENGNYMFNNCQNLTDIGNISSLIYASAMFYNCINLVNIGNINFENVRQADYMFSGVPGVTQELHDRFINTINVNTPIYGIFANCTGFNKAYISNRWNNYTYNLNGMYSGCELTDVGFDYDVTSMAYILSGSNITLANCTDNIINMNTAYAYCQRLTDAVMGDNVNDTYRAYADCYNLLNAACGRNTQTLYDTYFNCFNLTTAAIGNNLTNIYRAYFNCFNLYGDLDLLNVNRMYQAFYNSAGLQNIIIRSNNIELNRYHLEYAFYRTDYTIRRNVVLTNQNSFNNFIAYSMNTFGQTLFTQDTFVDPVGVNVNNFEYAAVRYAYNELKNIYVYCTE